MLTTPECLACGTCCFSLLETYVRVSGDDYARLGDRADELAGFVGHRVFMRMIDGHCGALAVDVISGQFVCGAYAIRPDVCRDLARESDACRGEIETKRDRPLLALRRARFG